MFIYELTNPELILIHLHGFASDVRGSKVAILRGRALSGRFSFFAMDMEYHNTTTSKVLEVLDVLVKGFSRKFKEVWLSGSSHGGYVTLNYLKFYQPIGVAKVFLFAPSYSTLSLTLQEVGEDRCREWLEGKEELTFTECETGLEITIHRDFAFDIVQRGYEIISKGGVLFPENPEYPIYVFHGLQDRVVPIEHSRLFVSKVRVEHFSEVEDDHRLNNTFKGIVESFL
ncbi:MAG: alpha/beta hydrolase [Aquificaceae bacterium]|nr:alpha/beta hydrolase [Aquificaceae bacterium]MCX8163772.1 alpha/beta hydrolase [Aquificaceae bacterium]